VSVSTTQLKLTAQERLARAKENYNQCEEALNGPARRFAKARQELFDALAAVDHPERAQTEAGVKIERKI